MMYAYNISELLDSLKSSQDEGYKYVQLSISEPEDDMPEAVCLNYVDDRMFSEEDSIFAETLSDDYSRLTSPPSHHFLLPLNLLLMHQECIRIPRKQNDAL